jgi:hypothetical protein
VQYGGWGTWQWQRCAQQAACSCQRACVACEHRAQELARPVHVIPFTSAPPPPLPPLGRQHSPVHTASPSCRCVRASASFTCPRCHTAYCSKACYKAHSVGCTEAFYREQATEVLRATRAEPDDTARMLQILQRLHQQDTAGGSDDSGGSSSGGSSSSECSDDEGDDGSGGICDDGSLDALARLPEVKRMLRKVSASAGGEVDDSVVETCAAAAAAAYSAFAAACPRKHSPLLRAACNMTPPGRQAGRCL